MIPGVALESRDFSERSRLDVFDPRARLICAVMTAFAVSSLRGFIPAAMALAAPLLILASDGRRGFGKFLSALAAINRMSLLVCVFLPLTYPGPRAIGVFSPRGFETAALILLKLNVISAVTLKMAARMGIADADAALRGLGVPRKLRVLILMTARYVALLADRVSTMATAVRVRAPGLRGIASVHAAARVTGTTLIHCVDRADRAAMALRHRGGADGFCLPAGRWAIADSLLCAAFVCYLAILLRADFV